MTIVDYLYNLGSPQFIPLGSSHRVRDGHPVYMCATVHVFICHMTMLRCQGQVYMRVAIYRHALLPGFRSGPCFFSILCKRSYAFIVLRGCTGLSFNFITHKLSACFDIRT